MEINPKSKTVKLHTINPGLILLLVVLIIWQVIALFTIPKGKLDASDLTLQNILGAVSYERTARNQLALNTDQRLSKAAQYKANDMQARHYFSHTDPEGNYIWGKIVEAGYTPYAQLGENLAVEFYNTESLIQAWMNSPTHRANILNSGFLDQGMGLAFGSPEQSQYYSSIANTFGALVPAKKPSPPPVASSSPRPSPAPPAQTEAQAPGPTVPQQSPQSSSLLTETQIPNKKTQSSQTSKPPKEAFRLSVTDRPESEAVPNFALPGQPESQSTSTLASGQAVFPTATPARLTAYEINRYVILGLGAILIIFVVSDLKKIFEQKFRGYDKKINNLVLLILSLIVTALIYWL